VVVSVRPAKCLCRCLIESSWFLPLGNSMTDRAQVARDVSDFIVPVCTTTSGKQNNNHFLKKLVCYNFCVKGCRLSLWLMTRCWVGGWGSFFWKWRRLFAGDDGLFSQQISMVQLTVECDPFQSLVLTKFCCLFWGHKETFGLSRLISLTPFFDINCFVWCGTMDDLWERKDKSHPLAIRGQITSKLPLVQSSQCLFYRSLNRQVSILLLA
jgi:hypothetical protein